MNSKTVGIMNRISDTHIFKHEEKLKENYNQYLYTFLLDPTVFIILSHISPNKYKHDVKGVILKFVTSFFHSL